MVTYITVHDSYEEGWIKHVTCNSHDLNVCMLLQVPAICLHKKLLLHMISSTACLTLDTILAAVSCRC